MENFSPSERLLVHQSANQSEYALTLEAGFIMRLRPRPIPAAGVQLTDAPGRATIPVLSPADILATLDERQINADIESLSAWMRHLVIRTPELNRAATDNPRAATLQRLADIASAIHNAALARQLDAAARRISSRISSPSRTGIGTRVRVPSILMQAPRASGSAWMDAQAMRLARQAAEIQTTIGLQAAQLPTYPWQTLRANAELVKADDAYHSTTMEGYRISREVSDAIVRGEPLPGGPQDSETLRSAMAIQGYAAAFSEVLVRARKKAPVDTDLILDLHEALFRPAVDAGITDSAALRGWRNMSVGLRGWRYVPPNPKKIPDLIGGLESFANQQALASVSRALLVHLEFVTIHPFLDGNGRLGRLLMNHVLLSAGHPWVTVRSDERVPFFRSMEQAQVDNDTRPFIHFLWHLIAQSARDLRERRSTTRSGRRGR